MKKHFFISTILLIFCIINTSFGFVDQRYQYWQIQLNSLHEEKNKLSQNKNYDRAIIKLINSDIKRAESILTFFERSLDTESSDFKERKYSAAEIDKEIKSILKPVFSLSYLEFILTKIGTRESYTLSEKYINSLIDSAIINHLSQSDSLIQEKMLNGKFDRNDWKYLSSELWLEVMISNRERTFSKLAEKVEIKILNTLAEKKYKVSPKYLKNIIETASNDILAKTDFEDLIDKSENPLKASWCWNEKKKVINHELKNTNSIKKLLSESKSEYELNLIYSSRNEILKIEELYFNSLQNSYLSEIKILKDKKNPPTDDFTAFDNPYFLNIPELPKLSGILSKIDEARSEYISDLKTQQNSIARLKNKFSNIILTSTSKTELAFRNEENLLNDLKKQYIDASGTIHESEETSENDGDSYEIKMTPINKAEFDKAKIIFIKQTELAYEYIKQNLKFLGLTLELETANSNIYTIDIIKRIKRNRQYINALKDIALDCSGLETLIAPSFHKRYHSVCIRISNLFTFINYSFNPEAGKQKEINPDRITEINIQKDSIKNEIVRSRERINKVYISMIKSLEAKRKKLKAIKHEMKDDLVNTELELLSNSLGGYLKVYNRLNYAEFALKKYSEKYTELLKSAESGKKDKSLNIAISSKSIIPVIYNFSADKIKHELNSKNYLKNNIYKRISSIQTLITFYKRKGIKINYIPEDLLKAAKAELRTRTDIPVASWRMNELNFEKIDKKAVQKLQFVMKRKIWQNADNKNDFHNKIKINDLKISIAIPKGWIEQKVSAMESNNGIIKSFKSIDGNSTIYIAGYSYSNNVKDASEYWINEMKSRKVAQKWGEREASDYYWTLSNHTDGVMESYAISCKKKILIVSGISSRDKYNFFRKKMNSVFQSISSI